MATPQEILKEMIADAPQQTAICMQSYSQLGIEIEKLEEQILAIKDAVCDPTKIALINYLTLEKYEIGEYVLCPGPNFGDCLNITGNLTDWSICVRRFDNIDPLSFHFKIISPNFFITPGNHVSMFVKHSGVPDIAFGKQSGRGYINVVGTSIDDAVLYNNDQSFPADTIITMTIPMEFTSDVSFQIPYTFNFYKCNYVDVWSTSTSMNVSRNSLAGCGDSSNALSFGGYSGTIRATTEKWISPTWTTTTAMNVAKQGLAGCGNTSNALSFGGNSGAITNTSEKWSGSAWATTTSLNESKQDLSGFGNVDSAMAIGGFSTVSKLSCEKWNGGVWAITSTMNTAKYGLSSCGTTSSAISFGGFSTTYIATTERWASMSWATTSSMNITRNYLGGCGEVNNALSFGGARPSKISTTEKWNGSVWATTSSLNVSRSNLAGCGSINSALSFGGDPSSTTEKWGNSIVIDPLYPFIPTTYNTNIEIVGNRYATIMADYGSHSTPIPYIYIDSTTSDPALIKFDLPVIQQKIIACETKHIASDIHENEFPEIMEDSLLSYNPDIYITAPGDSTSQHYIEYDDLYFIPPNERGFVSRKTATGRKITFGNGIYGIQPVANSSVNISTFETLGSLGNVPAGTILLGDNIYCIIGGITHLVEYDCINTFPAENGYESISAETQVTVTEDVIPDADTVFLWYAQYNVPSDTTADGFIYTWTFGQDYIVRPLSSGATYGLQDLIAKFNIARTLQLNNAHEYTESEEVFKPFT